MPLTSMKDLFSAINVYQQVVAKTSYYRLRLNLSKLYTMKHITDQDAEGLVFLISTLNFVQQTL